MNDGYAAGYGGDDQYELVGYDEYGRPVYRQAQAAPGGQQQYDPYQQQGQQYGQQGYGYDPYTPADGGQAAQRPYDPYDPYGSGTGYDTGQQPATPGQGSYGHPPAAQQPYDPYGQAATSGPQPRVAEQTAHIPQQA
ncbi:LytR family transcriptional regulator, partial [Streptomyces sp. NPDC057074]